MPRFYNGSMHTAPTAALAAPNNAPPALHALTEMVGDTPLLALHCRYRGSQRTVYAKAEFLNLTGSIKDRMALHILADAYRAGRIRRGDTIVEATSGNTGIALSAIGRAIGHPVVIYMPDWMSHERRALIGSFGARVELVSKAAGGFLGSVALAECCAKDSAGVFLPRQFSNEANVAAHAQTTGPEIAAQLDALGLTPHAFVAGVGTGGTVMGVGRHLRARYGNIRIHPLEPAESPTLSTGCKVGQHRIQGVSDEFIPAICQLSELDPVIAVSDGDAILMAQKLAATLGLGVGPSSGANFLGALKAQDMHRERHGRDAVVVTIFPDDNKKYLSTDLLRDEPVRHDFLSPDIELDGYQALPRAGRRTHHGG